MPVPWEIRIILAAVVVMAVWMTWSIRSDWLTHNRVDAWRMVEIGLSQFFLLAMLVCCSLQVIVRHFLAGAIALPWTEELARLAIVWAALWGAAALHRSDAHIRLSLVYDLVPPRAQAAIRLLGSIVTIAVLAPVVWYGWRDARNLDAMSTVALGLPLSTFAYAVPVACGLMILHSVRHIVHCLRALPGATRRAGVEPNL